MVEVCALDIKKLGFDVAFDAESKEEMGFCKMVADQINKSKELEAITAFNVADGKYWLRVKCLIEVEE